MLLDIDININKETAAQFARNFRAYQKRETIPIIAEISNLLDGALLLYSCFSSAEGSAVQNVRKSYVQQKGVLRFALLLIPIVGSLLVSVLNFFNSEYIKIGCYKVLVREPLLQPNRLVEERLKGKIYIPLECALYRERLEKQQCALYKEGLEKQLSKYGYELSEKSQPEKLEEYLINYDALLSKQSQADPRRDFTTIVRYAASGMRSAVEEE